MVVLSKWRGRAGSVIFLPAARRSSARFAAPSSRRRSDRSKHVRTRCIDTCCSICMRVLTPAMVRHAIARSSLALFRQLRPLSIRFLVVLPDHHFSHRHTRPIRLLRLQWLPTAVFTGYADGSFERGECLELLWGVIFGDGWQGQRRNATQLCGSTAICPQHAVNCDIQGASEPSCCRTEQANAGYVRCELCRPPDGHGQYFCEQSNAATQLAP